VAEYLFALSPHWLHHKVQHCNPIVGRYLLGIVSNVEQGTPEVDHLHTEPPKNLGEARRAIGPLQKDRAAIVRHGIAGGRTSTRHASEDHSNSQAYDK